MEPLRLLPTLLIPINACFEALYSNISGEAINPATVAVFTIEPDSWSFITGSTYLIPRKHLLHLR